MTLFWMQLLKDFIFNANKNGNIYMSNTSKYKGMFTPKALGHGSYDHDTLLFG